ncbi:MAG: acyltransferase [Desulfomonilia bacterium]
MNIISNLVRKLYSVLSHQKRRVRTRLLLPVAGIHPSTLIDYGRIQPKKACTLTIDELCQVDGTIIFEREHASVILGKRVFMSGTIIAAEKVTIGDDVLVSWSVTIVDHNSHSVSFSKRSNDVVMWREQRKDWVPVKIAPVNISDKVWIGFNSIILCGVTIGEGAIIGAGSVVTSDVPAWSIAAGNPARVIREIPVEER